MKPTHPLLLLSMTSLLAFTPEAAASSSFSEPSAVKIAAKKASKKVKAKAFSDRQVESLCKQAQKENTLQGTRCRMAILEQVLKSVPKTQSQLKKKSLLAKAAEKAALSLIKYQPLRASPSTARDIFDAHQQTCRVLVSMLDTTDALSERLKTSKTYNELTQTFGKEKKGIEYSACSCLRDAIGLGTAASLSTKEMGSLQGDMTSRGCFLDKDKVREERGGPEGNFSGRAQKVAQSSTEEAKLLDYAKTRDINFQRCRDKWLTSTKLKDKAKMQKCVCSVVSKWSFPKDRNRKETRISVPLVKGLAVELNVKPNGKTERCGPLSGNLAQ